MLVLFVGVGDVTEGGLVVGEMFVLVWFVGLMASLRYVSLAVVCLGMENGMRSSLRSETRQR